MITKAYQIYSTDGYTEQPTNIFFSTLAAAEEHRKKDYMTGSPREVYVIELKGVLYKLSSIEPIDLDQKKAKAKEKLAKETLESLSPAQREALGLK